MRALALAAALTAGAASAAELERMEVEGSVSEAADRLVAAVEEAGATVVARVDHAANAATVGETLPPSVKVIFGNPALGTPVIAAEPLAGYVLPLQVLVYEDADGQAWVAWEPPAAALEDLGARRRRRGAGHHGGRAAPLRRGRGGRLSKPIGRCGRRWVPTCLVALGAVGDLDAGDDADREHAARQHRAAHRSVSASQRPTASARQEDDEAGRHADRTEKENVQQEVWADRFGQDVGHAFAA